MRKTYDPGRVYEGTVLLAGLVTGAGLVMFRSEDEGLAWLVEPDGRGGYKRRPGRRLLRFQVSNLAELEAVLPGAPYLKERE